MTKGTVWTLCLGVLAVSAVTLRAQEGRGTEAWTLVEDDLTSRERFMDLTLVTTWGEHTAPTSALALVRKADASGLTLAAVKMADEAAPHSRWDGDLRASTAIDYEFERVDRSNTLITVECDVLWDELESGRKGKWGEGNRFLVALLQEYPKGGPKFGDLERVEQGHPFGRPAYHFRIRNIRVGMGAMMSYGGGPAGPLGEFEKYTEGRKRYWLPGFISSAAKGQAPGDEKTYDGKKSSYPIGPTQKGGRIASDSQWRHVTWRVYPERLELYWRPTKDTAAADRLLFFMDIPMQSRAGNVEKALCRRLAASHGLTELKQLPPLYHWFPAARAVRFYFRGNKTYLANIVVSAKRLPAGGASAP